MAASGARAVVLFAIQLLLLTFAIIGGGLLVRPAAAAAADANVDIGGAGRGSSKSLNNSLILSSLHCV
jgi:hypothetical protein